MFRGLSHLRAADPPTEDHMTIALTDAQELSRLDERLLWTTHAGAGSALSGR